MEKKKNSNTSSNFQQKQKYFGFNKQQNLMVQTKAIDFCSSKLFIAKKLVKEMENLADLGQAIISQRFFKTGQGEYGEGDVFIGLRMPVLRKLAKEYYRKISLEEVLRLLVDSRHEVRMVGLLVMNLKYIKADAALQEKLFEMYISNTEYINNWDLVDLSAPNIVGCYLLDSRNQDKMKILYNFAESNDLWKKRIAVLATLSFIRINDYKHTLAIAKILLYDKHDLIHKAVGWMLREVGKKDIKTLKAFLDNYSNQMPRTMLRYSIEKLAEGERKNYLNRKA